MTLLWLDLMYRCSLFAWKEAKLLIKVEMVAAGIRFPPTWLSILVFSRFIWSSGCRSLDALAVSARLTFCNFITKGHNVENSVSGVWNLSNNRCINTTPGTFPSPCRSLQGNHQTWLWAHLLLMLQVLCATIRFYKGDKHDCTPAIPVPEHVHAGTSGTNPQPTPQTKWLRPGVLRPLKLKEPFVQFPPDQNPVRAAKSHLKNTQYLHFCDHQTFVYKNTFWKFTIII